MRHVIFRVVLIALMMTWVWSCKKEEATTKTASTETTERNEKTGAIDHEPHRRSAMTVLPAPVLADCSGATEQEFVVDVTFTGLVTFLDASLDVTKPLPAPMSTAGNLKVLIHDVKAGDAMTLPPGTDGMGHPIGKPIHKHTPFVGTDVQYICKDSTAQIDPSWCPLFAYHELKREAILWDATFIASGSNPSPLSFSVTAGGMCPTAGDMKSTYWVPSLSRVGAKGENLDHNGDLKNRMLGTSLLSAGTLEACVLSPQVFNFRDDFKPVQGSHSQAIAEEVHYLLKGKGKTFTVKLKDTGGSEKVLVLRPVNKRVELRVGNLPENFIPVTEVTILASGAPEKWDSHFGVYHRVLANKARKKEIPFDAGACLSFAKCPRTVETRPCADADRPVSGFPSTDGANCGPNGVS